MIPRISPALRRAAESVMVDRGELWRPSTSGPVLDPDTGELNTAAATRLWSGPCRVLPFAAAGAQPIGEQRVTLATLAARVPYTVTDVKPGDLLKVTASADPRLVGRSFTVESVGGSSAAIRRELIVTDDQG